MTILLRILVGCIAAFNFSIPVMALETSNPPAPEFKSGKMAEWPVQE